MAACANPLAVFTHSLISLSHSRPPPPPLSLSRGRAFGTGSRSSYPHLDNRRKIKNEFKARKYPRKGGYLKDSQLLCAEENKKHPSPSRAKKNSCSLFCPVFKIEGFFVAFSGGALFLFFPEEKRRIISGRRHALAATEATSPQPPPPSPPSLFPPWRASLPRPAPRTPPRRWTPPSRRSSGERKR